MKEYIKKLPQELQDLIYLAKDIARRNNMTAYLVGGFVRDLILGEKDFDLDIVIVGDGIKFAEDYASRLNAKLIRHRRFGTATIIGKIHAKIDISSARKEFYPHPAHLPVVESGSLRDDLFRRDFTINAMAISISENNFGELIDLFGGKIDLRNKVIRVMHELSFIDDPTRILRAVRFEQRYGFKIEPQTLKLLKESLSLNMLGKVEPQRVRDDLVLILKEKNPLKEIKRIQELSGFGFLNKKLHVERKMYYLLETAQKEILWFQNLYPHRRHLDTWLIYLMGLFDSLDKTSIRDSCHRFAFKKGEEKRILDYKGIKRSFISKLSKAPLKASKVYTMLEPLSYEVIIMLKAKYRNRYISKHLENFFGIYNGMRIHVNGNDLRKLGVSPGPCYQKIFKRILQAKLDGKVKTKEDELVLIEKLVKNKE